MAFPLNFLHEIERRRQDRRRDPLKLSLFGLGGVLVLLAGFYFYELERVGALETEAGRKTFEIGRLQGRAGEAARLDEVFQKTARLSGALVERMEARFYWAPFLEGVARSVPPEVQLVRVSGEISGVEQRGQVGLEGVAVGPNPREVAERFRAELKGRVLKEYREAQADFRALEDAPDSAEGQHQATFQIQLQFLAGRELPKPPPPRVKRNRP